MAIVDRVLLTTGTRPVLDPLQETAFSCDGKQFGGYYADPEMDCQAYHICLMVRREGGQEEMV